MAPKVDKPIAALIQDLKRRGLLESTLLLWGGEFGRSPEAEARRRECRARAAIITTWASRCGWRAAASRAARSSGATDDIGLHAVKDRCHFRDIHTTILHQLGLDQDELSYPHLGRRERLTLVHGRVIEQIV